MEPKINEFIEKTEFPQFVIDSLAGISLGEIFAPKNLGGISSNCFEKNSIFWEVSKFDPSIGTFLGVHFGLGVATIEACGDDE